MHKIVVRLFICIVLFSSQVLAQKSWEKPFTQWTKQDALKILSNSPWAETREVTDAQIALDRHLEIQRERGQYPERGGIKLPPVIVRLYSALPVRQALIRLNEIEANDYFDNKVRQAEITEQNTRLLECKPCKDNYVITLLQPKNSFDTPPFIELFKKVTFKEIQEKVYLANEKGEKRNLIGFIAPKRDEDPVIFLFQRHDENGKPLFNSGNKKIILNFNTFANFFEGKSRCRILCLFFEYIQNTDPISPILDQIWKLAKVL